MRLDEVVANLRETGPTVNVEIAARALGVSRQTLYAAISTGQAPVQSIKVLGRIKVLTESVVDLLEGRGPIADPERKVSA